MKSHRGQNLVEYILLVTAVIVFMFFAFQPNGSYRKVLENSVTNSVLKHMDKIVNEIQF